MNLQELLVPFRKMESNDQAIVMVGDDECVRVFIAWKNARHDWRKAPGKPPPFASNGADLWDWLCKGWDHDLMEISRAAGVTKDTANAKLYMLMKNRLIYPDGTASSAATLAVQIHMSKKLGIKLTKKKEE